MRFRFLFSAKIHATKSLFLCLSLFLPKQDARNRASCFDDLCFSILILPQLLLSYTAQDQKICLHRTIWLSYCDSMWSLFWWKDVVVHRYHAGLFIYTKHHSQMNICQSDIPKKLYDMSNSFWHSKRSNVYVLPQKRHCTSTAPRSAKILLISSFPNPRNTFSTRCLEQSQR